MSLTYNGFIVQGTAPRRHRQLSSLYRGPASRDVWPLWGGQGPGVQPLSEELKQWFYRTYGDEDSLWACPEAALVARYLRLCESQSVGYEVVLCRSARTFPAIGDAL